MAVRVHCPSCRAGLIVYNPKYLVVVNCHACGHEFLADGEDLSAVVDVPLPTEPVEDWAEAEPEFEDERRSADDDGPIFTFCPMCGELVPEFMPYCPACGESLPEEGVWSQRGWDPSTKQARRFRRQALLLGVLWIFLAYLLVEQDYWVGGTRLVLPEVISGAGLTIPPLPLMATGLVSLAAFALAGQFWAVAVGGLLNYLILFLMVWQANVISLVLLAALIILTHITLHQASSARFR